MIVWFDKRCIQTIGTKQKFKADIASLQLAIDALIQASLDTALASNDAITEYHYSDGMTKTHIKREYRDVLAITAQIKGLMSIQQLLLQSPGMNSRVNRMIDSKNMNNFFPIR